MEASSKKNTSKSKKQESVKIDDVAEAAGVSKATVSRVMNHPYLVQADTVQKVRKAMGQLNYAPNAVAQSMRSRRTKTVGVVIPDLNNQFYSSMLNQLEQELRKHDYVLIICPTSGDFDEEKEYIERMLQRRVDGIMMFTYNNGRRHVEEVLKIIKDLPFILMDECVEDLAVNQVVTDGYNGVRLAVEYLIERGHTQIACVGSNTEAASKRVQGYLDAMRDHDLEVKDQYVVHAGFNIEDGLRVADEMERWKEKPTATICVSDSSAVGLINGLKRYGRKIPDEMEVIGFNDIEIATVVTPALTTVAQNLPEISKQAVRLMMRMIDNVKKRSYVNNIKIAPKLVVRGSTK